MEKIAIKFERFKDQKFAIAIDNFGSTHFGGKLDVKMFPVIEALLSAKEQYNKHKLKYLKANGKLTQAGYYSLEGQPSAKIEEFERLMEELNEETFELPICEPISLRKRKKHRFTTLDIYYLRGIFVIDFDESDDGSWVDKDEQ